MTATPRLAERIMSHPVRWLDPFAWHTVDASCQPKCPACTKPMPVPMLFTPGLGARLRRRPEIGGRGPTPAPVGWVHLTYRHRKCGAILEIALEAEYGRTRDSPLPRVA